MAKWYLWAVGLGAWSGLLLGAQEAPPAPPLISVQAQPDGSTGTVTGTVILGDTQHGARFAQVTLQAVSNDDSEGRMRGFGGGGAGRTGLDGTFTISNVGAGDYYVMASAPGYLSERAVLQAAFNGGASSADLAAMTPTVHVSAGGSATVNVTLPRGAMVGGRLQWEDGSPAAGVQVMATATPTPAVMPQPFSNLRAMSSTMSMTDDRGAFRISGLPAGDYLVMAIISPGAGFDNFGGRPMGFVSAIHVYAPGVFRKGDAKPVSLRVGDDRDDLRMVIDLSRLRKVSGHTGSTVAGQSIVSGRASLTDSTDATLQPSATIDTHGDFVISYVPAGTYTLSVQGSTQSAYRGPGRIGTPMQGVTFQPYTQTITVGDSDVTGLGINLTPAASH